MRHEKINDFKQSVKGFYFYSCQNLIINNCLIELETFIKYEKWDEAIDRQKTINKSKLELLEFGKKGWDTTRIVNKS